MTDPGGGAPAPDLRLVPAAVGSWLVAILGLTTGSVPALVAAGGALLVATVALGAGSAARPSRWAALPLRAVTRPSAGVLACTGCMAAVGLLVGLQMLQLEGHPLRGAAEQGSAVTLRVRATGDPAPVLGGFGGYGGRPSGATQVSLPAQVLGATVEGVSWTVGGRILLLAPREGWADVLPGSEFTASGLLTPATRPDLTVAVLRVRGPPADVIPGPWWQRAADVLRDGLRRAAAEALPERPAQLLPGLAIGDTSTMSAVVRDEFRTTGLTHLTAVSGANVAIVCGAVFGVVGLLRGGPRARVVWSAIALVGFVVLVRPSPSVLRAAVMGAVGLAAVLAGRQRSAVPALAAAVIGLLLVDPALGTDPGFALSVLATGALVLLAPGWVRGMRAAGVPPGVAEALAVPAAAHLVTAPVVAGLSGQVSLVAVVANLLAGPAVAPATVLGVLAALASTVSPALAWMLAWLAGPSVRWLVWVAHWGAGIPGAAVDWPAGALGGLAATLAVGALFLVCRSRRLRALAAAALLGLLLVLVPTRWVSPGWPATGWSVVACDVGQGDAIALSTGEPGRAVLVDTGTETGAVDGCLSRLGIDSLALVVLTHLHADHVGGLGAALGGRSVAAVAVSAVHEPVWAFEQVRRVTTGAGAPLLELKAGQRLAWPGLVLDVLAPSEPPSHVDADDGTAVNDVSLVLRATTALGRVLLTGDVELSSQSALLASGADLRADVLKVPHHGSRFSSPAFLAAVHPRIALVSVGAGNTYGHPNGSVLDLLRRGGALVRRTDESGDVAVAGSPDGPVAVARGSPTPAPRGARHRQRQG